MNMDIHSQAEELNKKHRRKRTWYKILSVPICLVVFVTTYALILPAITMESTPDTYCGIAEHVHTDDCYELPGTPAHKEIQCTAGADLGQGEYIIHKHDSFCFDDSGELLCALAEQDEHVHTDACYDGDSLICGLVTGIVHQHTADCVVSVPATEPQGLVCTLEEHKHTEACFINPEGEASSGDTPEDDAAVNSTPARAPAASGPIKDVTLTINDNVSTSGCYEAAVTDGAAALEGKNVQYLWYKSTDGGATYTAVTAKNFTAGGKTVSNISGDHGEKLFLALDGGTVSDTLPSVTYKAVLMVDGTVYDSVSAELTNTTYQASVLNGSFEAPDLTECHFQEFVPEETTGLFWKTTASNEEGGQPTYPNGSTQKSDGKHYIEIIDTGTLAHKKDAAHYHKQDTPTNGKQYAEINAGAAGALYQTIATIPGTTMYWSVDHSGRNGTDTMAVVMMPESSAKDITTQDQLRQVLNNPSSYGATEDDLQLLSGKLTFTVQKSNNSSFTNPETVMTYTATNLGSWTPNGDGSWTLSARISMKDQAPGYYYRIEESGAELDGFNLTATDTNAAVLLQSTTVAGFTFTNTYADTGRALKLTKIVNAPDTTGSFTFTVSYTDAGGKTQTQSVTLKNSQSNTITGIPRGAQVTVTETTTDGYTVIMRDHSTGTVLAGSSSYTFTMKDDTAVDIYNTSTVALPETGGIGRGIFLYAGIGLMLTAVITGCLLRRKYGKEGD